MKFVHDTLHYEIISFKKLLDSFKGKDYGIYRKLFGE